MSGLDGPAGKNLAQLLSGLKYLRIWGDEQVPVQGLAYHSGRVASGEVFVALKGCQTDGHLYIDKAIERGAAVVVLEDAVEPTPGVVCVQVPDTRLALAHMAAAFYDHPSCNLTVVGITGTNGKTTTSYLLEAIWQASGAQVGVIGTVNCRFGSQVRSSPVTTPESLDLQDLLAEMRAAAVDCAIMEVSSHALDLKRVQAVRFAAGLFTNLSQDHLDYHGDMESYFAVKSRLFCELLTDCGDGPQLAVINRDDPWGQKLLPQTSPPVLTYGFAAGADIRPEDITLTHQGIQARLHTPYGRLDIVSPLMGRYNLYNILAASGAALGLGISPEHVVTGLANITGVDGRLEPVAAPGQPLVLVDYAHTPDALEKVLAALKALDFDRIITVFGCGGDRDRRKRPLMGQVVARGSDVVIITSDNPRTEEPLAIIEDILAGLREMNCPRLDVSEAREGHRGYLVIADRRQAIRQAIAIGNPGEVILLAGKGHETYQILGTRRIHFDDREEAAAALSARAKNVTDPDKLRQAANRRKGA
ncbi:UDP-N-acetylmuramoyl-L-alanyl-D-glutamate--2,6-diaminopimelate ligase [Desulfobacca acetoxidans]|uniref:UDP-N-acetylmuramoyl-L-alanyl-D-glutamate--2,6-diaminopimelate ligase n=1 Tax=Desulfobacca acetoxidans (strain ATCC 700848 / DSM 11109 / ASRB2) TaxID=880072 RepID=F2NG75_DESAR|nr:UDP-N-acetylmuramoyl-L-alanyl-D-glutamate--2,6-diaminopimelate ligase [Desulfobacca acetoxidans]AEB08488.1 UDP-N-acetylmuramoyl-L-alanyl-D-glutamate--2,6-d iaminopimelate ligase [Desulfobacca acetoxidans DSM 11109]